VRVITNESFLLQNTGVQGHFKNLSSYEPQKFDFKDGEKSKDLTAQ